MKLLILICFTMILGTSSLKGQEVQTFPTLKAERLTKEEVIFPDDLKQKANILILVFEQQAQKLVDTWAKIILDEYEPRADVSYHEVPMISTWYAPIGWQIDNWMRGGIPEQFHNNTATFYGNRKPKKNSRKPYFEQLDMPKKNSCYVFVLDENGRIKYRVEGPRTETKEAEFRDLLSTLISS